MAGPCGDEIPLTKGDRLVFLKELAGEGLAEIILVPESPED